jgi:asparagine synthase (glutamine-hydrolysing)
MCGFAGVVTWEERYRVTRATLERMSAAVAHRGPDGEGYHFDGDATQERPQVALAFRRLAILDPDPRSNQPFTDGRHWLVFNGEIYNFRELRVELARLEPEYRWQTTGDTEVLLRAYAIWGERCVDRLNGMYAFAIWDGARRALFLARDPMGQKPLYVASKDGVVAFASEVAALRPLDWIDFSVWDEGLIRYLRYGHTDRFYQGCFQHPPGFTRTEEVVGEGYLRRHFHPELPAANEGLGARDVRTLVTAAVTRQLVSDVPLGVFLSGGVDSSVIAAAARTQGPVQTFSIGFDDPRYDESTYAEEVAKHLGTQHHVFHVRPDAAEDLPKLAGAFGEPFADSSALPTHYLARETRKHVKVALSGDGGDELFGGYDRYRAMQMGNGGLRLLAPLAPLGHRLARGHPKSKLTRAGRFLATLSSSPALRYDGYVRLFDDATLAALLRDSDLPPPQVAVLYDIEQRRHRDAVRAAAATDRAMYLPDDLLTKVDRASMLHNLEVRSPFMDPHVVHFAATLTTEQLLGGGPKRMLREPFAKDLPASVFTRPKMGFAVPIGDWFRGALRSMLRDHLFASDSFARGRFDMAVVERLVEEHEHARADHAQRLYALLMLELWRRL